MLGSKERQAPHPTYMSEQQMGQLDSMFPTSPSTATPHRPASPSKLRECFTAPGDTDSPRIPTTGAYLRSLRKTRLERPTGSRPPPPSRFSSVKRTETAPDVPALAAQDGRPSLQTSTSMPTIKSQSTHRREDSGSSLSRNPFAGRPLVRQPSTITVEPHRTASPEELNEPSTVRPTPSIPYTERGSRWMEKQEAHSIRQAMEDMRVQEEEERRLHAAARDEAADLVWRHQNPNTPFVNPDNAVCANPDLKRDYRSHLRKGSYRRSVSSEGMAALLAGRSASQSSGEESQGGANKDDSTATRDASGERKSMCSVRRISPPAAIMSVPKTRTPSGPSYGGLAEAVKDDITRAHRRSSSGSRRILSGEKKLFMHPNDRIWEDPEEGTPRKVVAAEESPRPTEPVRSVPGPDAATAGAVTTTQPAYIRKNPFARVRMQADRLERSQSDSVVTTASRHHRVEIQKNPPSQSRNPWYISNVALPPTPPAVEKPGDEAPAKDASPTDTREIRGDDIRAATSKSRKDYSPKLPRPTFVSDKPGRPIVSFQKPAEVVLQEMKSELAEMEPTKRPRASLSARSSSPRTAPNPVLNPPSMSGGSIRRSSVPRLAFSDNGSSRQSIPTINLPGDDAGLPSIIVQDEEVIPSRTSAAPVPSIPTINVSAPSINISGPESSSPTRNSLPGRPAVHHAATSPLPKSTPHYTPTIRPSGTLCAHCALPIAGRILSADGQRFHPTCFNCHACNTNLELVAFYPEPETHRLDRLSSSSSPISPENSDPSPRFYCHLDFHELFSPRCKSCKTPIEGEVVLACGAHWHVGHFFCAQCGDPFDPATPFVERDGYAWCVPCHAHRSAPKCRACRRPVVETVVKALGADWHAGCFVCKECKAEFVDGRFFLRGGPDDAQIPVCVACEERRLKA